MFDEVLQLQPKQSCIFHHETIWETIWETNTRNYKPIRNTTGMKKIIQLWFAAFLYSVDLYLFPVADYPNIYNFFSFKCKDIWMCVV
jgi:hypothetical protein